MLVCVSDRIRFAMWCGNDYLPAFKGVGWTTVKKIHAEYESLGDEESQVALTHHHHPHRGHHHHPHSSHNKPLSPSQEQFLLQLALTKRTQSSVFESDAPDTVTDNVDAGNADPYKERIPRAKKKKRKRHKVVVPPDRLETCRNCDMANCSIRIAGDWCCRVAPDLPQFSSDEDEEEQEAAEPEEEEEEEEEDREVGWGEEEEDDREVGWVRWGEVR